MKRTRLASHAALIVALLVSTTASAQRPSLVDLQAALDELISPPTAAASGTVQFVLGSDVAEFPLVDLNFEAEIALSCTSSCNPNGSVIFSLSMTIEETAEWAELFSRYATLTQYNEVVVAIPSEANLLRVQIARIESIVADESITGRNRVTLTFEEVEVQIQSTTSSWNVVSNTGSGCVFPGSTVTIDLAGNSVSNLSLGEVEGRYRFDPSALGPTSPIPRLTVTRVPQDACAVRAVASGLQLSAVVERLWESNDLFPGPRQAVTRIDLLGTFLQKWILSVNSGVLGEEAFLIGTGSITTREFSPADGSETGSTFAPF